MYGEGEDGTGGCMHGEGEGDRWVHAWGGRGSEDADESDQGFCGSAHHPRAVSDHSSPVVSGMAQHTSSATPASKQRCAASTSPSRHASQRLRARSSRAAEGSVLHAAVPSAAVRASMSGCGGSAGQGWCICRKRFSATSTEHSRRVTDAANARARSIGAMRRRQHLTSSRGSRSSVRGSR